MLIGLADLVLGLIAVFDSEGQIENFSGRSIPGGSLTATEAIQYATVSGAQSLSGAFGILIGFLFFWYGNQHPDSFTADGASQEDSLPYELLAYAEFL